MSAMNLPEFTRQADTPLFPNILFNRPITRTGAGRLLVVGGHSGEFSQPTAIHQLALAAGVGECHVVLPDNLAKFLSGAPGTYFAASSTSGSLGREALGRILQLSEEADAVALGASLSNNSNTTILIDKLATEIKRPMIVFDEALPALKTNLGAITANPKSLLILTMPEVFKICGALGIPIQIRPGAGLLAKLEIIANLQAACQCQIAVFSTEIITCTPEGLVVTPINYRLSMVPAVFYAVLGTFWLQNPKSPHRGLATGAFVISKASINLGATDRPSVGELATAIDRELRQDQF
jgi:hypothetical protein